MQYGLPFQTVFRSTDPRLQAKLIHGTLWVLASILLTVVLVGLAGFCVVGGYALRFLRNVQDGQEHPLPEWDQWQDDLRNGFFMAVAAIVWFLPFIVLSIVAGISAGEDAVVQGLVSLLTTIAGFILGPGITIAFAQRMALSDAFRFSDVLSWIGAHWTQCLLVGLMSFLAGIVIWMASWIVGAIALLIGLIVMVPFAILMSTIYQYHLYGQLAQASDLTAMFPEQANDFWTQQDRDSL